MDRSSSEETDDSEMFYIIMINACLDPLLGLPLNGIITESLGNCVLLCSGAFSIK